MSPATLSPSPGASALLARFAAEFAAATIPANVLEHAKLCVLDSIGIALAAGTYDFAQSAVSAALLLGGRGESAVFGHAERLPLRDAVLANGTLIHALDFDDTHSRSVVHCTASAWPVAFNVGEANDLTGLDALAAYVLAVELDARIGEVAAGGLQKRGFHPTGIVGAFGCAAATAWCRRLTAAQHAHALGIVLSMASGSMAFINDGAWTKRIHPGWSGVAGITAAALAESGVIGPGAPLEGRFGLYDSLLGPLPDGALTDFGADLGQRWRTLEIAFKPYPACHFNHAFADCALTLKRDHNLDPGDIESMTALIHPDQIDIVCEPLADKQRPRNAYEAQFSVPYIIAASLVYDRFGLAELADEVRTEARVLALAARVDYAIDRQSSYPKYYSGGLAIRLKDGRQLEHHQAVNRGADAAPLDAETIRLKYQNNAERAISTAHAQRIADIVLGLESAPDLRELSNAVGTESATNI